MPDITLDATILGKIASNQLTDADNVTKLLYDPQTPPETFDVINGQLTAPNFKAGITHEKESVQPGAFTKVSYTGATANLDYFQDWWTGITWTDPDDPTEDVNEAFLAISGASRTFYLPYDVSFLWVTWNIVWTNVSDARANATVIKQFIDGVPVEYNRRLVSNTFLPAVYSRYAIRDRYWTGHYVAVSLSAGWHTASLQICADTDSVTTSHIEEPAEPFTDDYAADAQSRVRVRGFRTIAFK